MPFCTPVFVGLSEPLLEMVKGLFGHFLEIVKGLSGPLPEMIKGMCLEPVMLYRPPLASSRCGWMMLPDVGDYV